MNKIQSFTLHYNPNFSKNSISLHSSQETQYYLKDGKIKSKSRYWKTGGCGESHTIDGNPLLIKKCNNYHPPILSQEIVFTYPKDMVTNVVYE